MPPSRPNRSQKRPRKASLGFPRDPPEATDQGTHPTLRTQEATTHMTAHFKLTPSRLRSTLERFAKARGAAQPAGTARPHSGLRMAPLRWASQDHPKVVTISQFAARRDGEASFWSAYDTTSLGLPGARDRCGNFAVHNPQRRRGFTLISVRHHSAGPPRGPRCSDSFAIRSPHGRRGFILACV